MATPTVLPPPPKPRRWLRILFRLFLALVLFIVVVYFVATSSAFLKGVILPRASKALNATITVSDASISPFSQVVLRDLKVQTTGSEPLLTAAEVRTHYNLPAILRGNIKVDEVTVMSPTIQIVQNADGTSNLDPLTKTSEAEKKPKTPEPSKTSAKPPELDVKKVLLSKATVRLIKNYKNGQRDLIELSDFTLGVNDLKNGQAGTLNVSSAIHLDNNPPGSSTNSSLQAALDGNLTFALSQALKPANVRGQLQVGVEKATGSFAEGTGLSVKLDCDVTPTDVKQLALRFQKRGATLGEILVNGPFDLDKIEGHLAVQVRSINREVLNLAGAAQGMDFGSTSISSSNQIGLANAGKVITAVGELAADKFSVSRANQTTPPLELRCNYNVTVDQSKQSALLQAFTVTVTQNQQPLVRTELAGPMTVAWGASTPAVPDSTLNCSVTNLNLADWKPFLGDAVSAGIVNLSSRLQSQQSGKLLVFDLSSQLNDLAAKAGSNQISQAAVALTVRGQVTNMNSVNLEDCRLQVAQQGQPVVLVSTSGHVDTNQNADLQISLDCTLANVLRLVPQPGVSITSGTVQWKGHIVGQQKTRAVTGTLTLADFSGKFQANTFQQYGVALDLDLLMKDQLLDIRKANGALRERANPGGGFEISGNFDLDKKSGQVTLKLADLNQNALRPFLDAALGDKKLVSVSLNGNATAGMGAQGESSVNADIQLSKLVVHDPQNQIPETPLAAGVQVDASLQKQVADIRKVQITLTPTQRATNQVALQGRVDMSQTNAYQGGLKLTADSLDVTPYYDLFAGKKAPSGAAKPAGPAAPPAAQAPAAPAGQEPPATSLPFRNFPIDVNIGRFYLREIEITNWVTALKIDGGQIDLNPLQMAINGAPLKAKVALNLGVPGYQYDVAASADKIPLEPLANSFMPEQRGQYKGDVLLNTQIKGVGTTGANLQKNLAGQLSFAFTNASIQIAGKSSFLTTLGTFLNARELSESPLNWVNVYTEMGSGRIDFKDLTLVSPKFQLQTGGVMPIAEVLTNSPFQNWPVNLYLSRSLAERVRLVSSGAPSTGDYVKLPNFLKVAGTLGAPKAQIDKAALAGTLLEKYADKIPGTGGLLQGIGGILPGGSTATNAPAGTNTNQPPAKPTINNLLDLLKKPKK